MIRHLLMVTLLILTSTSLINSQSYTITGEAKVGRGERTRGIINYDQGEYILQISMIILNENQKNTPIYLKMKNNTVAERNRIQVPFEHAYNYKTFSVNNKIYKFIYVKNKENRSLERKLIELDTDGKTLNAKDIDDFKIEEREDFPFQHLEISPDSNYILTVDIVDDNNKKKDFFLRYTIFDRKTNVIHSNDYIPSGDKSQQLTHCFSTSINNDGQAFILLKKYESWDEFKKIKKKPVANFEFKLLSIDLSENLKEYRIDNEGEFTYPKVFNFEDGTPVVVGEIHHNHRNDATTTGTIVMSLDESTDQFKTTKRFFTEKEKENLKLGYKNKKENKFIRTYDQYLAIGDKLTFAMTSSWHKEDKFYEESAFIHTIDRSGAEVDFMAIPRYYKSRHGSSPIILSLQNDKPSVLYVDFKKNLKKPIDTYKNYKRNRIGDKVLVYAYKDQDNSIVRKKVDLGEHDNKVLYLANNYKVDENRIAFPIEVKGKLFHSKVGILTIKL